MNLTSAKFDICLYGAAHGAHAYIAAKEGKPVASREGLASIDACIAFAFGTLLTDHGLEGREKVAIFFPGGEEVAMYSVADYLERKPYELAPAPKLEIRIA